MSETKGLDSSAAARTYDGQAPREETSLFGFLNVLLKYRGTIVLMMVAFGAYGLALYIEAKPTYTARIGINVRMAGSRASQNANVSDGRDSWEEVAFFNEMLRSPSLLRETAKGPFTARTEKGVITGPLGRFYGFQGRPELYQDEMTKLLTNHVEIASSSRTGNTWISVHTPYPELSQQIAANLVQRLDDFSRRRRQAFAAAEREFVEERLAEARAALRAAESQLVQFRLANQQLSSPTLTMSESRLARDVSMKQALYTSLLQAYDRARLDEARNLPVITLLEEAETPAEPEPSSSGALPVLGAIAGLLFATILAFIRERMIETAAGPSAAFSQFQELKRETISDLKNPLRPLGRALKARSDG